MKIDASTAVLGSDACAAPNTLRQDIQIATLKKVLESQKQEAAEMLKLLEPKGRVLDIRA